MQQADNIRNNVYVGVISLLYVSITAFSTCTHICEVVKMTRIHQHEMGRLVTNHNYKTETYRVYEEIEETEQV